MLFSLITFIIYLDRGVIASNGVQGDSPGRQGIQVAAQAARSGFYQEPVSIALQGLPPLLNTDVRLSCHQWPLTLQLSTMTSSNLLSPAP